MSTSAYRARVAEVAARAKEKLPQAVNGRVESAVKLVLGHDVTRLDDGSIEVGSSSDPMKTYRLEGSTCTCQDFERGQAPDGWCQHRIAAGIAKRVGEVLAAPVPVEPDLVPEAFPDNDPEDVAPAPVSPAVPLPEAPASCNVYVTIGGHNVQVTLRDRDEQRMLARLQVLLTQYPAPQSTPPTPWKAKGPDDTPQCPQHSVLRKGKRGWFCPVKLPDGSWCPSKAR